MVKYTVVGVDGDVEEFFYFFVVYGFLGGIGREVYVCLELQQFILV